MKKAIALILTVILISAFCACSKREAEIDTTSTEESTITENIITTEESTATESIITTQKSKTTMNIKINGENFTAEFYDNKTAQAFADILPLTINMEELHGNEKYYYLDNSLPTDSSNIGEINTGDIMLYGTDCLVLFYDTFNTSYSYTRIGYITDTAGLKDAVGSGSVTITFEK